jgi:hypothetical protein
MKSEIRNQKAEGRIRKSGPRYENQHSQIETRISFTRHSSLVTRHCYSAFCLLLSAFCFLPSAFAGTHVTGVYSVGASPAVMATVNGNSEYGLVFAQRNKTVTYNNILYVNNVVTAYFDVNGNLNDGNGNAWIDLIPDANAAPGDSYYVVTINIQGSIHSEIWIVPDQTSAGVLSVRQTTAPPSGTANFFYQTLQQSGASLAQRPTLNLTGTGISCLDNSGLQRTDCTMTAGGFANPMTSPGDLIVGGAAGSATRLALGSNNLCLTSNGATAVWASCLAGSGTVTSFSAGTLTPLFTTSVASATTTPALTFALTNQNANLIYAGPSSGAAAAPTFRGLVGADLPNPSATTLGGVESMTAVASKWINALSTSGVPSATQPAFTDVSGSLASGQLPAGWNPVTAPNGGTGVASPAAHQVLVAEGASPVNPISNGTAGQVLISNGSTADPAFADPVVSQATASNLNAQVVGNIASAGADSGNPVKTGGVFNTTQPTALNGQRVDSQATARGAHIVATGADTFHVTVDSAPTTAVTGTFWQATQPVSLAAAVDVSDRAARLLGHVTVDTAPTTAVTGTFWQATQPVSGTVTANAGTNLNTSSLQLDATGAKLNLAQGATTSGETGPLVQGAVTTSAPTYTAAQTSPLSLTTAGALRTDSSAVTQPVSGTFWQATQPVSGTVTANAGTGTFAENVSQINGVAPLMGNGVTGTGSQRVTIASDNTAFGVNATQSGTWTVQPGNTANTTPWLVTNSATSATGSAVPAKAGYIGGNGSGNLTGITVCDNFANINISIATTTLLVTGVSAKQVHICSIRLVAAAADNVALIEGTGATCGTGTAGMDGGTTAASGFNFSANGGMTQGTGVGEIDRTVTTGDSVCVVTSGAVQLSGKIGYTIF